MVTGITGTRRPAGPNTVGDEMGSGETPRTDRIFWFIITDGSRVNTVLIRFLFRVNES